MRSGSLGGPHRRGWHSHRGAGLIRVPLVALQAEWRCPEKTRRLLSWGSPCSRYSPPNIRDPVGGFGCLFLFRVGTGHLLRGLPVSWPWKPGLVLRGRHLGAPHASRVAFLGSTTVSRAVGQGPPRPPLLPGRSSDRRRSQSRGKGPPRRTEPGFCLHFTVPCVSEVPSSGSFPSGEPLGVLSREWFHDCSPAHSRGRWPHCVRAAGVRGQQGRGPWWRSPERGHWSQVSGGPHPLLLSQWPQEWPVVCVGRLSACHGGVQASWVGGKTGRAVRPLGWCFWAEICHHGDTCICTAHHGSPSLRLY